MFQGRFSVGQNIARTWTTAAPSGPYDFEPEWKKQIGNWFNEVHHYVSGYHRSTGHYTQVHFIIHYYYYYYYSTITFFNGLAIIFIIINLRGTSA